MKAQILKIAGVKTEKEFYKKYKTEADFMKVHGKEFKKAQTGAAIEKAQFGNQFSSPNYYQNNQPYMSTNPGVGFNPGNTTIPTGGISAPNAQAFANKSFQASDPFAMKNVGNQFAQNNPLPQGVQDYSVPSDIGSKSSKGGGFSASMIPGMIDQASNIYNAFESQKKQKQFLQQQGKLLGLTETLSQSTDVNEPYQKHVNDRPENYIASTNSFYPAKGTGYDILRATRDGGYIKAQNGNMIGGNPTEIQNTFAPYDIYSDGGYEPLNDSDKVKSFQFGGEMGNAIGGGASSFIGSQFNNSAGSQAGAAVGNAFFGPLGGAAGSLIGGGLDQAFGDAGKINKLTQQNQGTQERIMNNSMWKGMGQFGSVRQEGGYLNPEYNPQVITMFGDHNAEDFADYAHKYRAGGHLKEYTAPSDRAMETYAEGGELKTHWGGEVEPVSYNPYSEGEGLTYNAYGNSHFQKDQQGRTGIGLSIMKDGGDMGDEPDVEIETNEPISMTGDGAVVYGNLNTNKDLLEQFQLPEKYANRKVKHIVNNMIVPKEQKYTKELERITSDVPDDKTKFGMLGRKTIEAKELGLNMKLKKLAQDKENLAAYQDHIHKSTDFLTDLLGKEVSQEKFARNGEVSHILAKGEISQGANAQAGKTLKFKSDAEALAAGFTKTSKGWVKTKKGTPTTTTPETTKIIPGTPGVKGSAAIPGKKYIPNENAWWRSLTPEQKAAHNKKVREKIANDPAYKDTPAVAEIPATPEQIIKTPGTSSGTPDTNEYAEIEQEKQGFPWLGAASSLLRGFQPAFNMPIGSQINPELYAMADNNVEGLNEPHMYSMLQTPYKYSADRDRNAILSQARQAVKNAGNNPAAQAAIMAQVADSMGQVSSREGDINQQGYQGVYNQNIATVNQDRARNLGIDMDSAMKLSQAKSNLQAKKLAAMTSAEAKIAANKRENMEYNIGMAEHPDYTFGPDGRIIKLPRYVEFDTTGKGVSSKGTKGGLAKGKEFSYDDEGNIIDVRSAGKEEKSRNGKSIKTKSANSNVVRAFKGF